jgi:nicotinamide N-methyltransferase
MPQQHTNLLTSMNHFLSSDPSSRIYAIAGFHTGRVKVAAFFDAAEEAGLEVEFIEEVDVLGNVRPWAKERDGGRENITERKRWLVTARLKRRA